MIYRKLSRKELNNGKKWKDSEKKPAYYVHMDWNKLKVISKQEITEKKQQKDRVACECAVFFLEGNKSSCWKEW